MSEQKYSTLRDRCYRRIRMSHDEYRVWQERLGGGIVAAITGIPSDAVPINVAFDDSRQAWDVTIWSASFPAVPIDEVIPRLLRDDLPKRVDLIRRNSELDRPPGDIASRENPITA